MAYQRSKKIHVKIVIIAFLWVYCNSSVLFCQNYNGTKNTASNSNLAIESEAWNGLFHRNKGWFGGDGIFGIPLDGKEFITSTDSTITLFTFGDTMIGNHDDKRIATEDFTMINNSIGFLKGRQPESDMMSFHYKAKVDHTPASLFVPRTERSKEDDYYWLGDGFVNVEGDGNLYIFAYPIHHVDTTGIGGFGFEQIGVNLLKIPFDGVMPNFERTEQIETPFFDIEKQTSFGSAIYVNTESAGAPHPDGNIYIYAVSNLNKRKGLIVARIASSSFLDFDKWRFWNGFAWVTDVKDADHIAWDVSNEMSVSPLPNGKIALVYQYFTLSDDVTIQIGESLTGPFNEQKTVYKVSKEGWGNNYFPYNAKAYPHLSTPDSLLISYNVNSFDFFNDILNDPNLYRPRYVKVSIADLK